MVISIEAISHLRYIEFLVTVIVFSYIRVYYWVLKKVTMSENLSSILLNKTNHHLAWPEYLQNILKKMGRNYQRMYVYANAFLLLFLFLFLGCM